jgi:hypothetical protein
LDSHSFDLAQDRLGVKYFEIANPPNEKETLTLGIEPGAFGLKHAGRHKKSPKKNSIVIKL